MLGLTSLESAKIYQQVAEAEKVPIDSESLPTIIENRKLKSDKVHPNGQGYQRLGDAVFKLLQETVALWVTCARDPFFRQAGRKAKPK